MVMVSYLNRLCNIHQELLLDLLVDMSTEDMSFLDHVFYTALNHQYKHSEYTRQSRLTHHDHKFCHGSSIALKIAKQDMIFFDT